MAGKFRLNDTVIVWCPLQANESFLHWNGKKVVILGAHGHPYHSYDIYHRETRTMYDFPVLEEYLRYPDELMINDWLEI